MKAGRELDALVAEKVMGWSRKELPTNKVNPSYTAWYWVSDDDNVKIPTNFFNPSTNITDALLVLEEIEKKSLSYFITKYKDRNYVFEILAGDGQTYNIIADTEERTIPLVICLAALKAVGVEVDE